MRLKEFKIIVETVEETQDILRISQDIIDFLFIHKATAPGTVIDVSQIPGLTAKTPAGKTLINSTRLKIVSPDVWKKIGNDVQGDAAPYYTDPKGNYGNRAYPDARTSREVNQGKFPGLDLNANPEFTDLISHSASQGNKLDIRLNTNLFDLSKPGSAENATSILSHELGHHLDTIKGRNNVADYDQSAEVKKAQEYLDKHNQAKKLVTPENPNPPGLLSPADEKRLIGIVKKAPKTLPVPGTKAYWADTSEINARLVQSSEDLANFVQNYKLWDNNTINETIKYFLIKRRILNCFVPFTSDAEFKASLTSETALTNSEIKQAYQNPEFKKLYNRLYKFFEAELAPGGTIALAQKDGFKNWASATAQAGQTEAKSLKQTFIDRFIQKVIKGIEVAKDVAKLAMRYTHMADAELKNLLVKRLPELVMKGGLKSIPFVGLLIGVAFGIDRLIDNPNDLPGAALDVVGGIGSLYTAIPATAYQAARDMYGEYYAYADTQKPAIFEYDMANDPQGTTQRVKELADKVAQEIKERFEQNKIKLSRAQGASNQRSAVKNFDTPGNPSPALHPELYPQQESLQRLVDLSNYKS
jgi:hypothetical protein